MTVYKGEEVSIEVDLHGNDPDKGIVWANIDGQNAGELVNINWIDKDNFISELTAVINKYKV